MVSSSSREDPEQSSSSSSSSMSSSSTDKKKKKYPVVKLALEESGDQGPFRRIVLRQDDDGAPPADFVAQLRLGAIELSTGSVGVGNVMTSFYDVQLTYQDTDGDPCVLVSHADVLDALEQYESQGRLKIFATVQAQPPPPVPTSSSRSTSTATQTAANGGGNATTAPPRAPSSPRPGGHRRLVESVVGVLATAMEAIQGEVHQARALQQQQASLARRAAATTAPTPVAETASAKNDESNKKEEEEDKKDKKETAPTAVASSSAPAPAVETRPFIHGCHTCNGCLRTPIVGTRWHATNRLDFDFCDACKEGYKGSDMQFEPVELDRDVPFQDRWHRRLNRWGSHHGGRPGFRRHGRCGGRRGHGRFPPMGPAAFHNGPPPPCFAPPPHAPPRAAGAPCPPVPHYQQPPAAKTEDVDLALKEAIRRSMQDMMKPAPPSSSNASTAAATLESSTKSAAKKNPAVKPVPSAPPVDLLDDVVDREDEETPAIVSNVVVAEDCPRVKASEEEIVVDPMAAAADVPVLESDVVVVPAEDAVASSFASDAAGSGEVAHDLGATMDKIANEITEMTAELDRKPSPTPDGDEEDDSLAQEILASEASAGSNTMSHEVEEEDVSLLETPTVVDDGATHGATIISGEDTTTVDKDDESGESWMVVTEEEEQIATDEALARAAQVIGSALFHSDMSRGSAGVSAMSQSHVSVSSVESVPSTLPSITSDQQANQVPAVQLERWAIQLQQLHELGFHNDVLSVEILERLNAANIGVDEMEEITVTQVVNELMKDW